MKDRKGGEGRRAVDGGIDRGKLGEGGRMGMARRQKKLQKEAMKD
jgi:hypothetical protein